jgi:hypothetical protein
MRTAGDDGRRRRAAKPSRGNTMLNGHIEVGTPIRIKPVNGHSSKSAHRKTAPPKEKGVTASPAAFVQLIVTTLRPLLVDVGEDFEFGEGRAEIDVYRALLEACGSFTVADAVKAAGIANAARVGTCEADPIRYGALYEMEHVFQSFIASARPSSPDCVSALAKYLAIREKEDGEQRLAEVLRPLAETTLNEGLAALRSNDFSKCERFASGGEGDIGWCKRAVEATGRQKYWHPTSPKSETGVATDPQTAFLPASFVDRLIDAVLPLVNDKGDNLGAGKTQDDVVMTLLPLCGHFTVADAVLAVFLLDAAESVIEHQTQGKLPPGHDNPRGQARYRAWSALADFACHGWAMGPACVSARASMLRRTDEEYFGDDSYNALLDQIERDIRSLRSGDFASSDCFGQIERHSGGLPDWLWRSKR